MDELDADEPPLESLSRAAEDSGVDLSKGERRRFYRALRDVGWSPSGPSGDPVSTEELDVDSEERDEVMEDRVRKLPRKVLRGLLREKEKAIGRPLSDLEVWTNPTAHTKLLAERLTGVLMAAFTHFDGPGGGFAAVLNASMHVGRPILARPAPEGGVQIFLAGQLSATVEAVDALLADHQDAPELDELPETIGEFLASDSSAEYSASDPPELRAELAMLRRELRRVTHLCSLQGDLVSAYDALIGHPVTRRWAEFAVASPSARDRSGPRGLRTLSEVPEPVSVAAQVFEWVRLHDLGEEEGPKVIGDGYVQEPVHVAIRGMERKDEDNMAFGFSVTVRDPWVPERMIEEAVETARSALQARTTIPNLSEDDRDLIELVQELEARWKDEGRWPKHLTQRPPGFWDEVRERWNDEHPERKLKTPSLRGWYSRLNG